MEIRGTQPSHFIAEQMLDFEIKAGMTKSIPDFDHFGILTKTASLLGC